MPVKILVVDDEPDLELLIRQRFRKKIRDQELEFSFAADGFEALQRLEEDQGVDIMLTDINMPRMDGLTLLGQLPKLNRLLKVVIVSAYGDMDNIRTAMNRGAFDFVTKPINFEDLEITIDRSYRELEVYRQAVSYRQKLSALQRELEIASRIQLSAVPSTFPAFPDRTDFDLHATMIPAQEVGGDFYDFFLIDDSKLGFVLGDVAGKGIGSAIFMAITSTLLRATALQGAPVEGCLNHLNRVLQPLSMPRMFVTLVYGILDTFSGEVTYCNAGHNLPYVMQKGGEITALERTGGIGLCLKRDFEYGSKTTRLNVGDTLFLYSDGVTEAANPLGEQFSEERLCESLQQINGEAPKEILRDVLRAVESFSSGEPQADDITMLALQYLGGADA